MVTLCLIFQERHKLINKEFEKSNYWSESWVRHIENYLSAPPRCGIWLETKIKDKKTSIHECAGGSCRDSRYLFNKSYNASGSDFDEKTIKYVVDKYSLSSFPVLKEDAFKLSFKDNTFEYVYHNGFWVCYEEDDKLIKLLLEQARVAKRYVIALVHNAENIRLVKTFKKKSEFDSLYKIRFFSRLEIEKILIKSGVNYKSFSFEKFGGPFDKLYLVENKYPYLSALVRWLVPRLYRFQPWIYTERIALFIKLK
jgi:hypothetical protein